MCVTNYSFYIDDDSCWNKLFLFRKGEDSLLMALRTRRIVLTVHLMEREAWNGSH